MQDDLSKLKQKILDELIVITDEADMQPLEKFEITMTRYVNSGDVALLSKAYEFAQEISDPKEKGSALLQLLEEIDIAQIEAEQSRSQPEAKRTKENEGDVDIKDNATLNISIDKESK